jgi:hypothetical protein
MCPVALQGVKPGRTLEAGEATDRNFVAGRGFVDKVFWTGRVDRRRAAHLCRCQPVHKRPTHPLAFGGLVRGYIVEYLTAQGSSNRVLNFKPLNIAFR